MNDKIIAEHRQAVVLTGNLSDFQLNQLQTWPYIIFDKELLDSVEVSYNFKSLDKELGVDTMHSGVVEYNFKFKKNVKLPYDSDNIRKRLLALQQWVKLLFWEDTEVNIKKNGRKWKTKKKKTSKK